MPTPTQLRDWQLLEQVILSGQMREPDLHARLQQEPEFATWLGLRARLRLDAAPPR